MKKLKKRIYSDLVWNSEEKKFSPALLTIANNALESVEWGVKKSNGASFQDYSSLRIGPSAIDLHVHVRDFEERHKQTFDECEAAAQKGGVAALVNMANTFPRLDHVNQVKQFFKAVEKRSIRFLTYAAVSKNLEGKDQTEWEELLKLPIAGLSDDGKPIQSLALMEGALKSCKKFNKLLSLHEEDLSLSQCSLIHAGATAYREGIEGSPADSEALMVERDIRLAEKHRAHVHLGHISSRHSVRLIEKARRRGVSLSAELTPHHGLLTTDDLEMAAPLEKPYFKVCPVIRERADQLALLKGAKSGVLDCFASDHAPHSWLEKEVPYRDAAHGIISLENYYPLYLEVREVGGISWDRFFSAISSRPAELLHLKNMGSIRTGNEASFVIFSEGDAKRLSWTASRSKNTPMKLRESKYQLVEHWVKGQQVYAKN